MSFTDDDLKRFKKYVRKAVIASYERKPPIQYALRVLLFRLLARLKAAEAFANYASMIAIDEKAEGLYQAWQKARK